MADGASERQPSHGHDALKREKLLSGEEIAAALTTRRKPWDARRARRFLKSSGIGFQLRDRGLWYTTWGAFFDRYPHLAQEVLTELEANGRCAWCGQDLVDSY